MHKKIKIDNDKKFNAKLSAIQSKPSLNSPPKQPPQSNDEWKPKWIRGKWINGKLTYSDE